MHTHSYYLNAKFTVYLVINFFLFKGNCSEKTKHDHKKSIITLPILRAINFLVLANRQTTASIIKQKLNLSVNPSTIRKHLRRIGWKKIRTRCLNNTIILLS